jgi:hypothetical protein
VYLFFLRCRRTRDRTEREIEGVLGWVGEGTGGRRSIERGEGRERV